MEDMVVWGDNREELKGVRDRVREFLAVELKLELKAEPCLNRTALGMDFLGYRLFPRVVRLARRSKIRFARKLRRYERAFVEGWWSEGELQQRTTALLAFVMPAESGGFRRHVLERFGVAAIGLEPRDPGRQLEQQREQLPVGTAQQQQPVQQEQQHWVPGCPGPSSTRAPEGAWADPAAIPSCPGDLAQANRESEPPGASRGAVLSKSSGRSFGQKPWSPIFRLQPER
jgi:hypothetical protein